MEGLNQMTNYAKVNGWISGLKATNREDSNVEVSHWLCADDSLVFCDAKVEQIYQA